MERIKSPKFKELKVLLLRRNNTYDDLAECVGTTKTTIIRKIFGRSQWSWDEMLKIKEHYELTDEEFMNIFFNREVTEM